MKFIKENPRKIIGLLIGVILLVSGIIATSGSASAATPTDTQHGITVRKYEVNAKGQPRFKITTTDKSVKLLFSKPNTDYRADDFEPQEKGTTVMYPPLPKVKSGTTAEWTVVVHQPKGRSNPKGPTELFYKDYLFSRYKKEIKQLRAHVDKNQQTDVYLEVHPKSGGKMKVKSARVRASINGVGTWVDLTHAYTDGSTGVQVYVTTLDKGAKVKRAEVRSVYGKVVGAAAGPVGDLGL
jgi:hypothetical protein